MIEATYDNVLVKAINSAKPSAIVIPDQYKKRIGSTVGEVVSVGPTYPYDLKEGDRILFQGYENGTMEGIKIEVGDEEYLCLREKWVLAKIGE